MIPVPKDYVHLLDLKKLQYNYKRLLTEQYNCINLFYNKLCCNYKLLEEKSIEYNETLKV